MANPPINKFENLNISGDQSVCDALKRSLEEFPAAFYDYINWMFKIDGGISPEFIKLIEDINVEEPPQPTPQPNDIDPKGIIVTPNGNGTYNITWPKTPWATEYTVQIKDSDDNITEHETNDNEYDTDPDEPWDPGGGGGSSVQIIPGGPGGSGGGGGWTDPYAPPPEPPEPPGGGNRVVTVNFTTGKVDKNEYLFIINDNTTSAAGFDKSVPIDVGESIKELRIYAWAAGQDGHCDAYRIGGASGAGGYAETSEMMKNSQFIVKVGSGREDPNTVSDTWITTPTSVRVQLPSYGKGYVAGGTYYPGNPGNDDGSGGEPVEVKGMSGYGRGGDTPNGAGKAGHVTFVVIINTA